ncbi:recombinase family protein [Chloroflexota bacterium]
MGVYQRGFEVIKVYEEEESAWKSGHQRVLANLITDTRQRRFQAVLIWALDRSTQRASRIIICFNWPGSQNEKSAQK